MKQQANCLIVKKTTGKTSPILNFLSFPNQRKRSYYNREASTEILGLRSALEDSRDQLDATKRENKNLTLEVNDLVEQVKHFRSHSRLNSQISMNIRKVTSYFQRLVMEAEAYEQLKSNVRN